MDFNELGMPVGIFFDNETQTGKPKTVNNAFKHKGKHWECKICSELFDMPQSLLKLQDHLDVIHCEGDRW